MTTTPERALLINSLSGRGITAAEIKALHEQCIDLLGPTALFTPAHPSGMKQIVQSLSEGGCKAVLVHGGDGTLNLIASQLLSNGNTKTAVCLLNGGSGGDFAKTIWGNANDAERLACLKAQNTQLVDSMLIKTQHGQTFYAMNTCSLGASALIAQHKTQMPRQWPGWIKYLLPTLRSLNTFKPFQTTKHGQALAVLVSNGRYAGGGMLLTPLARLDDGLLNHTIIRPGSSFQLLKRLSKLFTTGLTADHLVEASTASVVTIATKDPLVWERDGECGDETNQLTITCLPKSLRIVVPHAQNRLQ